MKQQKTIWTVWKKEIKDTLRDRRTLMSMILMPIILMPLLTIGMVQLMMNQYAETEKKTSPVIIQGQEFAPDFANFLTNFNLEIKDFTEKENEEIIRNQEAEAIIEIPKTFTYDLKEQLEIPITVYYDSTRFSSATALDKINSALNSYNQTTLNKRLQINNIDLKILNGLNLNSQDIATEEEKSGFGLGMILPMFIVMWSVIGGQYTAIDVSAGEKERHTLEALLSTPVKRLNLVLGKFLAVSTTSLVSITLSITSMYLSIKLFGVGPEESASTAMIFSRDLSVAPTTILIIFSLSALLCFLFASLLLSLGIFARSFKEAQSYISPAYLVIVMPTVIINNLPNFRPGNWFFLIPSVNAMQVFKEILMSQYNWTHISLTLGSTFIFAVMMLILTTHFYQKEDILFKN